MNEHRTAFVRRFRSRLLSTEGLAKAAKDPTAIYRTLKTFARDRNLRKVPPEELLSDSVQAVEALARLADRLPVTPFADWLPLVPNDPDTSALGELLKAQGSDKSTEHDYFEVYGAILHGKRSRPLSILEIGLGTNNLAFQSNMGLGGRPGASLRAFRDWAPLAKVFGGDIDRDILFQEDRIDTFWVDQTDLSSLSYLVSKLGDRRFDLIIDDGLHLPHANLNTIRCLLPMVADGGTFVVEDIDPIHLDYWIAARAVLADHDTYLVERLGGWLFIIKAPGYGA